MAKSRLKTGKKPIAPKKATAAIKAATGSKAKKTKRSPLTTTLDSDLLKRLRVAAALEGVNLNVILERLISKHVKPI